MLYILDNSSCRPLFHGVRPDASVLFRRLDRRGRPEMFSAEDGKVRRSNNTWDLVPGSKQKLMKKCFEDLECLVFGAT